MPRWRRWSDDDGNAALEFITVGMILLLPLVYLVMAMAALQGGSLAVEGAARQAVRVFVQARTVGEGQDMAERAITFGLKDYGLEAADATVSISCRPLPNDCLHRLGSVTIRVSMPVRLPLTPPAVTVNLPLTVPIEAEATEQVSRFWSGP